jgi:hypothetical protein
MIFFKSLHLTFIKNQKRVNKPQRRIQRTYVILSFELNLINVGTYRSKKNK